MIAPDLAAEALFCSPLQHCDGPTARQVNEAVEAAVLLHGSEGLAELVAQEFGDHPDLAVRRMRWCVQTALLASVTA